MKKILSFILLGLVLSIGNLWADAITINWLTGISEAGTTAPSYAGSASVNNIVTVNSMTMSSPVSFAQTTNRTGDGQMGGYSAEFRSSTNPAPAKSKIASTDYLEFSITIPANYSFTPTSITAKAGANGTGNNAAKLYEQGTYPNSDVSASIIKAKEGGTSLSCTPASTSYSGTTYTFRLYIGTNGGTAKGVEVNNVTLIGTYENSSLTKLSTPSISFNKTTGEITIGDIDANASKITYTTDGTDPTTESTTYSAPFIVNANCTVKAIAIGDGSSYSNSNIASQAATVTVENPAISTHNGTVKIACATEGATIKYNFDNGDTWNTYSIPFTLLAAQTVYAKAEHASYKNNSSVVNQAITAAPAASTGSSSITLYYDTETNFTLNTEGNSDVLTGKTGTVYEGFTITLDNEGQTGDKIKPLGYGSDIEEKTSIKGSNGRKITIDMPNNKRANRITIKSYNNGAISGTSLWSKVGNMDYTDANEIGLESVSDAANPDIRVFSLDNLTSIDLVNNGIQQQCFIAVVDYLEIATYSVTYKANNGTAEADVIDNAATTIGACPNTFTVPSGKAFAGWNTAADGTGTPYVAGDDVPSALTLYAQWNSSQNYLLIKNDGSLNTADFQTAVTVTAGTYTVNEVEYAYYSAMGNTCTSVTGIDNLNKAIIYHSKTNRTSVKIVAYNNYTSNSSSTFYYSVVPEGTTSANMISKALNKSTGNEYVVEMEGRSTLYITTGQKGILFCQVIVTEYGDDNVVAPEDGYSINLNKFRMYLPSNTETTFEGITYRPASAVKPLNAVLQIKTNNTDYVKFVVDSPVRMKLTTSSNTNYTVSTTKGDDTNKITPVSNTAKSFDLTTGTWYINPQGSNVNITKIEFEELTSVSITPEHEKSTYVTKFAMDFSNVAGLKAYAASAAADGVVTLSEVGAVPAATPLVLIGTADTEYEVPVVASASTPAVNMLLAGDGTTEFDGSTYDYILFSDGLFYQIGEGTVATNKAYLHCTNNPNPSLAPTLRIAFEENNATDIQNIEGSEKAVKFFQNGNLYILRDGVVYDVTGAKVR